MSIFDRYHEEMFVLNFHISNIFSNKAILHCVIETLLAMN